MPLLNYTTQIAAEKTVTEIQTMLAKAKAQAVMSEYDDGVLCALSFRIKTVAGLMSFRLPANVQKIYQVLVRQNITPKLRTREQAARVAWRIVKDWLEAQLALVSAELADLEQVFLPYAQDESGATLYEVLRDRNFHGLALALPSSGGGGGSSASKPSGEEQRHNDPKLSDGGGWRGLCRWVERWRRSAARAVTAVAVRCSAWLGDVGSLLLYVGAECIGNVG